MTDIDHVRDFEDRRWSGGDQEAVWRHHAAAQMVRDTPVLDVGGGDGLLLRMLRDRGHTQLTAVDLSPVAVEKARAAGFAADVADITQPLPYDDGAFATVCALDVLEHLRDPLPPLREMARVGRDVIIAVPNFSSLRSRLSVLAGDVPFQNRPRRGHVFWINDHVLRELFDRAELDVIEWRREPSRRLPGGARLADLRPNLFAVSFAARLRRR